MLLTRGRRGRSCARGHSPAYLTLVLLVLPVGNPASFWRPLLEVLIVDGFSRAVSPRSVESRSDPQPERYPPFPETTPCPRRPEWRGYPFPAYSHPQSAR